MLIVGWRKFQTCVPAQSCSTEMSSVEIGWIWISTTMLMMIRRILTMHYNCLGHARAFQKAFGKKIVFAFLARNQLICLSLNPPSPPPSLTTLSIRAEFLGQRGSWPRFLKPVTSSQKKLPKTLNPPTLSTIQTTKKSLKSEDAKKKTKTGGMYCEYWMCLLWSMTSPPVISRRLLSTFLHGHLVNIPMMLGTKIQGWVRICHKIQNTVQSVNVYCLLFVVCLCGRMLDCLIVCFLHFLPLTAQSPLERNIFNHVDQNYFRWHFFGRIH